MEPVNQINIKNGMKVNELVKEMSRSGVFGAGRIAKAANIFEEMLKDKECKIFFGFAGAMVPGGMKNVVIDMLKNGYIHVFVTTGANLTHDLIEALGHRHYKGSANVDDKKLHKEKIDRIYESYMQDKVYITLEKFFDFLVERLPRKKMDVKEFLWEIGKYVNSKDSILKICYEKKIPIFCPAISDSGIGMMIWGNLAKGKKIEVDAFADLKEIVDIAWTSKKRGIFYVGGGVPKNYIQQAMQFSDKQDGADYGIQITTDRPEYGGSSGAELREGISWGKMNEKGKFVDVYCDATIALPLIYAAVKDRLKWF
ncbi:MAG: deoxyhypusine synthase [Nanoarchaeota archaeon]